ncbi:unnamed protein product [Zymoseptoria tritici ST99CH_3D1]|uniref:F-box domain-containing protein n=2 Tax=Zymoseptoria tritici TaxID=1047171 RepID=A0A2H1G691_ZYMTR|nr:unnamed protein product [Zymoseptoria tritici ST99CH_1E4]SMR50259.1 unnamed protein product [Zymoseptoria tritici ST99CH_3D1]
MTTTTEPVCHLLQLPAELRNRIYEDVLSPGVLWLTRNATKRFAIEPRISPQILQTCSRIYNEAKNLIYTDNEVILSIDAHDTFAPVINESRLPQHALEKLQHVTLIVDCTASLKVSLEGVDFTFLEALVSLRTLRLGFVLYRGVYFIEKGFEMDLQHLMVQILLRVPATTHIECHFEEGSIQSEVMNGILKERARIRPRDPDSVYIVSAEKADEAFKSIDPYFRGQMSARTKDVFAEHRSHRTRGFASR